jgi:predicted lysophospholipase L1 biosynthesis ABC-type transport system permease subunit
MKKAIIGMLAIGAILALLPVARRTGQKMREHCEQMMGQFGDRAASSDQAQGHKMRERCQQMMARFGDRAATSGAAHSDQKPEQMMV